MEVHNEQFQHSVARAEVQPINRIPSMWLQTLSYLCPFQSRILLCKHKLHCLQTLWDCHSMLTKDKHQLEARKDQWGLRRSLMTLSYIWRIDAVSPNTRIKSCERELLIPQAGNIRFIVERSWVVLKLSCNSTVIPKICSCKCSLLLFFAPELAGVNFFLVIVFFNYLFICFCF